MHTCTITRETRAQQGPSSDRRSPYKTTASPPHLLRLAPAHVHTVNRMHQIEGEGMKLRYDQNRYTSANTNTHMTRHLAWECEEFFEV